jgi:hypothetical protein
MRREFMALVAFFSCQTAFAGDSVCLSKYKIITNQFDIYNEKCAVSNAIMDASNQQTKLNEQINKIKDDLKQSRARFASLVSGLLPASATDKTAMNYSLLYATAKAAEKACKNIEFAEVGAGAAIKTMDLIPEDMRAVYRLLEFAAIIVGDGGMVCGSDAGIIKNVLEGLPPVRRDEINAEVEKARKEGIEHTRESVKRSFERRRGAAYEGTGGRMVALLRIHMLVRAAHVLILIGRAAEYVRPASCRKAGALLGESAFTFRSGQHGIHLPSLKAGQTRPDCKQLLLES